MIAAMLLMFCVPMLMFDYVIPAEKMLIQDYKEYKDATKPSNNRIQEHQQK